MRDWLVTTGMLLLCGTPLASAQPDAAPVASIPVQVLPASAPQSTAEQDLSPVQLEAVRVSGDKLNRRLSETSTSTAIVSGRQIERGGSEKFHEVIGSLGNVMHAQSDRQIAIRGVLQNGNGGGDS